MDKNNKPEKKRGFTLNNIFFLKILAGMLIFFLSVVFFADKGFFREVNEVYINSLIFYLMISITYIFYKYFKYKTVSGGLLLLSFVYFLEAFEELVFFPEDGLVDRIEGFFDNYMILLAVIIMFFGFILVLNRRESKIDSLKHKSLHDNLTGIFNRRALLQIYGEKEISDPVTFCYIDLDGFKEINDRNGHEAGDSVLKEFAEIITRHKRSSDQFFRIGGDEFILVVDTLELEVVGSMIDRLSDLLKKEMCEYQIDFTCGFVPVSEPLILEEVLRLADLEMYKKKKRKKK